MTLRWISTVARTGRIITDLPGLSCQSVSHVIGTHATTLASLPIGGTGRDAPPADWERATLEGYATLVLVDDAQDGTNPVPLWGGMVMKPTRTLGDELPLTLATYEAYLDRVFVGDHAFTGVGQNVIAATIAAACLDTIPIRIENDGPGTARDRTYSDALDKTLLSALTELSGIEGGPEWTIDWEYNASVPATITPVLRIGGAAGVARIGSSPMPGLGPAATFTAPGSVTALEMPSDYSSGRGANDVMAVSTATGGERPQSSHHAVVDPDYPRPRFEHRWTPSTSITQTATLDAHAAGKLDVLRDGARPLSMTASLDRAPALGRVWFIGDDVGYVIEDSVPAFPNGLSGIARAIGWVLTLDDVQTVTPVLAGDS